MLVFIFLTLFAYQIDGKPASPTPTNATLCTGEIDRMKISLCLSVAEYMIAVSSRGKGSEEKRKFLQSCNFFLSCEPDLLCLNSTKVEKAYFEMKAQCKGVQFVVEDMSACDQKMEARNSTLNPFPKLQKEGSEKSCEDLYGKEEPIMDEIKKTCGTEDQEKFRMNQIEVAHDMNVCNYTTTN